MEPAVALADGALHDFADHPEVQPSNDFTVQID
jgi:hypothetical protein